MVFTNYRVILKNHRVISTNQRMILNKVSSHHFYNSFSLHLGVFSPTFYPPDLNDSRASFSFRAFYFSHFHLHILLSYHPFSSFASMSTHCNSKPRRGMIRVNPAERQAPEGRNKGSQPIHWLVRNGGEKRVPLGTRQQIPLAYLKARNPLVTTLPAIKMAGYPYQMPTA